MESISKTSTHKPRFSRCGEGDIVLLLHGALADQRMWDPHAQLLATDHQVIALTQRHFGPEGEQDLAGFGLDTHAADLISFVEALDTRVAIHLVAWSYGADVALNAMLQNPGLFASALLFEPGYPAYLNSEEMQAFACDAEAMFAPLFALVAAGELEQAARTLVDGSGNRSGYFQNQTETAQRQQLENAHSLVKQMQQSEQPALTADRLASVALPLTVACGENSRDLFQLVSHAAAQLIPRAQLRRVPGANHMLPIENPSEFCKLIRQHLQSVEALRKQA